MRRCRIIISGGTVETVERGSFGGGFVVVPGLRTAQQLTPHLVLTLLRHNLVISGSSNLS
jgi:hypothetical protein